MPFVSSLGPRMGSSAKPPEKPQGSISHSALSIQRDLAHAEGFEAGRAKMHANLATFIEAERKKGVTMVSLDLLERLANLWGNGA